MNQTAKSVYWDKPLPIIKSESEVIIMNTTFALQSTIEIILAIGFIWGIFNEHKLARIERKLFAKIKKIFYKKQAVTTQFKVVSKKAS